MEEILTTLQTAIRQRVGELGYMDQQLAYDQLAEWCRIEAETALKMEYMAEEMDTEAMNDWE